MQKNKKTKVAICYDFDGTLSAGYMQNVCLLPKLGFEDTGAFWAKVKENAKSQNMDEILAYMNMILDEAKDKNIALTPRFLMECGKDIEIFCGLDTWFDRINSYGQMHNIEIEHYIITSGNEEIIRGTSIAKYFKYVFGCKFAYKGDKFSEMIAEKPATAVNYTSKIQYLFRINKGVLNYYENEPVNRYMTSDEKYIDFANMIYIGDGETDVPCFKMVSYQGGTSIAVYNKDVKAQKEIKDNEGKVLKPAQRSAEEVVKELYCHKRVDFIAPTDYSQGSKIEKIVKNTIEKIFLRNSW